MGPSGGGLTDFVVSKVAMTVAALVVVGTLAGLFGHGAFIREDQEIQGILSGFCRLAETVSSSGADMMLTWHVPMMPTGAKLDVSIQNNLVSGVSGEFRAVAEPICILHTWAPNLVSMNGSNVEDLDRSAPVLRAHSGQDIAISSRPMVVGSEEELMVFVSAPV